MARKKVTVNRSAKTGKFVSAKYAKKHKPKTETERYTRKSRPKRK